MTFHLANGAIQNSPEYQNRIEQAKRLAATGKFTLDEIAAKTFFSREEKSTFQSNPRFQAWKTTLEQILKK